MVMEGQWGRVKDVWELRQGGLRGCCLDAHSCLRSSSSRRTKEASWSTSGSASLTRKPAALVSFGWASLTRLVEF